MEIRTLGLSKPLKMSDNVMLAQCHFRQSDNVMFVGDFNSKLEAFGCAKKNIPGPMLKNIQRHLKLNLFK